ncbi:hypothetical protein BASA81_001942 [Batrachochytrium salamandrivorans]|nr:hypothetical protein BASA81_001942 [Batrachochytrium salamandrivorans]
MANRTCPAVWYPATSACGEQGECVDAYHCNCPLGWSGSGDFVVHSPSCLLYLPAIQAEWAVVMVLYLVLFVLGLESTHRAYSQHQRSRTTNAMKKFYKRFTFHFSAAMLMQSVFFIVVSSLKVAQPDAKIGTDVAITVFYCCGFLCFGVGAVYFLRVFLDLNVRNTKFRTNPAMSTRFKAAIDAAYLWCSRLLPGVTVMVVIVALAPMTNMASQNWLQSYLFCAIHCSLMGSGVFIYSQIMIPCIMGPVANDITILLNTMQPGEGIEDTDKEKLRVVRNRIVKVIRVVRIVGLIASMLTILVALWPFAQNAQSYWIPVAWFCAGTCSTAFVVTNQPTDRRFRCLCFDHRKRPKVSSPLTLGKIFMSKPLPAPISPVDLVPDPFPGGNGEWHQSSLKLDTDHVSTGNPLFQYYRESLLSRVSHSTTPPQLQMLVSLSDLDSTASLGGGGRDRCFGSAE